MTISAPPFVDVGSVIEDLINQQEINALLSAPLGIYEAEAAAQLNGALDKPGLYAGLADAVSLPLLSLARPSWETDRISLTLGMGVALQSDTYDPSLLIDRARTLRPEADYRLGAAAQPLTASFSWTPFPGEWSASLGAFGALSRVSYDPVGLTTKAAGGSVHLRYAPRGARWGLVAWEGATLSAGGGMAWNRYETEVKLTLPTRIVALVLTYLDAGNVVITTSPRFQLFLDNEGQFWPVQLSTEVTLGQSLRLGLAAGGLWARGTSALTIQGTNPIHIESESQIASQRLYEKFLGDTAEFTVQGNIAGGVGPWWQSFVTFTPSWAVGAFRVGFPLTYRFPGGIAGSLVWGVSL